ncbi:hypothetical protein V2J09_017253 [Rumex salicifolius]
MAIDEGKVKIEKFDENKPEGMKDVDWNLLGRQALGVIRLTLSRNVAFNIAKEKTTTGLMAALGNMYEKPSASNKVHLMRRLFNLRMTEDASIAKHLNALNTVTTQLSSVGIEFDEEVRALILLSSLPESWNATVTSVSSSSGSSTRGNGHRRSNNHSRSRDKKSRSTNPNNSSSSKTIECWNCGKTGHYKNQCRSAPKNQETKTEVNITSSVEKDNVLICSLESKKESWVIDSGASFHAISKKENFDSYVSGNHGYVYLGDDQPCKVVGKGTKLRDVRHIPDLRKNLISVGQLADGGYTIIFHGDNWKVLKGVMIVVDGKKSGTLYITSGGYCSISVVERNNKYPNLWHQRLGHMSEKGMKVMLSKGKLPGLSSVEIDMCEECILGK